MSRGRVGRALQVCVDVTLLQAGFPEEDKQFFELLYVFSSAVACEGEMLTFSH